MEERPDAIHSKFIELLKLDTELMAGGKTRMRIPMQADLLNSNNMVHGGVLATLIDCAAAAAIRSVMPEGTFTPTIDLHINYLLPAYKQNGDLLCTGSIISQGKTIAHAKAEVFQKETLLAIGIGVFRIMQYKK